VSTKSKVVLARSQATLRLKAVYRNFNQEVEPGRKNEAGRERVRAFFGKDSVPEDSVFRSSAS
jgi:hypothetical protein